MAEHDFSALYARYPAVIAGMRETFTSHEFILQLAQQNQTLYIEALYSYRNKTYRDKPAPFMMVHGILSQHLLNYPKLIEQIRREAPSKTIFGEDDTCSEWKKSGY